MAGTEATTVRSRAPDAGVGESRADVPPATTSRPGWSATRPLPPVGTAPELSPALTASSARTKTCPLGGSSSLARGRAPPADRRRHLGGIRAAWRVAGHGQGGRIKSGTHVPKFAVRHQAVGLAPVADEVSHGRRLQARRRRLQGGRPPLRLGVARPGRPARHHPEAGAAHRQGAAAPRPWSAPPSWWTAA